MYSTIAGTGLVAELSGSHSLAVSMHPSDTGIRRFLISRTFSGNLFLMIMDWHQKFLSCFNVGGLSENYIRTTGSFGILQSMDIFEQAF